MNAVRAAKLYFEQLPQIKRDLEEELNGKKAELETMKATIARDSVVRAELEQNLENSRAQQRASFEETERFVCSC